MKRLFVAGWLLLLVAACSPAATTPTALPPTEAPAAETTEDGSVLAEYLVRENFPWMFATAPTEMLASLVEQFGRSVTVPPSTPHFVISPDGAVSQLMTGQHSADELVAILTAAAGA